MSRRRRIALFVIGTILVVGLSAFAVSRREPVHEGRKLTFWAQDLLSKDRHTRAQADAAIRRMNGDALPWLLEEIQVNHSRSKRRVLTFLHEMFGSEYQLNYDRHVRALQILRTLGPAAKPAVPELIRLVDDKNDGIRSRAVAALGFVGGDALPAMHPLVHRLKDRDHRVRARSAATLSLIGSDPIVVVPALIPNLRDAIVVVREQTAQALGTFGEQAKSAVPELLRATEDRHRDVRNAARNALRRIDPELAANLPGRSSATSPATSATTASATADK